MAEDAGGRQGRDPGDARTLPEVPVASLDAHGVVTAWSGEARQLLGYEPAEVVGQAAADLLAEELPPAARRSCTDRKEWSCRIAVRHQDGRRLEVLLQAHPLLDSQGDAHWVLSAAAPEAAQRSGAAGPDEPGAAVLKEWALAQLPIPVAVYDREVRLVGANEAMTDMLSKTEAQMRGLRLREVQRHPNFQEFDRLMEQTMRTGTILSNEAFGRTPGEVREHAWSMYFYPLRDAAGQVHGVSAAVYDTTDQYWARRRMAILNEASIRIGSTLDLPRTAQELADIGTDRFADFVTVDLLDSVLRGEEADEIPSAGPPVLRRVAQQSVLEGCPEAAFEIGEVHTFPVHSPPSNALGTGRPSRHRLDASTIRMWTAGYPARARSVRRFGIHSSIVVPLVARGITLGLALYFRHRTDDPFDDDDVLLVEEIGTRAAVCVDNARRYTRERATALTLQRSLLPQRTPPQSAVEIASRYLPAGSRAGVGGDWFDVIPLSGARVALVVGDVVGHGVHASATMGRLRTAVHTLADVDLSPDELLTRLDDLVIRLDRVETSGGVGPEASSAGEIGATCLYAVYDPVSRRCTLARAAHPPPVVVRPDGSVEVLDLPAGPPLGLGGLPFEVVEFDLPEGSLLALYTNGLIESAGRDVDDGLALLSNALARPTPSLDETCDAVLHDLLPERPTDDIALLLARTRALDADQVARWDLPADPAVVSYARRQASDRLAAWGLDEAAYVTELVVSELVTNAIRYGGSPIQLRLIRDTTLICEVSDGSNTAPHLRRARVFDEGGRGLLLVAQLTERWGTRHTPTGKVIWAEEPLPTPA
ncbi:SpoIIE family protein phosphatase [Streptomyces sp. KR80]|uniref:SpoIIE family protein phosphatase n=1 Tax=Streptomyces sp. KR80 TaxID=3457426 RepID=UPI003FD24330